MVKKNKMVLALIVMTLTTTLFYGCSPSVETLARFPERYRNKMVTVKGEVTSQLEKQNATIRFYAVRDETGQLWVATSKQPPEIGSKVTVKGRFNVSVTMDNQTFPFLLVEDVPKDQEEPLE